MYKGRVRKTIQYVAVKSVEKIYKPKVLNEVTWHGPLCLRSAPTVARTGEGALQPAAPARPEVLQLV